MGVSARMNAGARAVFLDRDGVLNHAIVREGKPYPPGSLDELKIVPGAQPDLERLKNLGYLLFVVTNQPDVARGTQSLDAIQAMHEVMRRTLPLDEFLVCPHDDRDGCRCRKPAPGLVLQAQERYGIDLSRSFMVGDRWRDIDAGRAAGCRTIFLDHHYRERGPSAPPDARVGSLAEAVDWIVRNSEEDVNVAITDLKIKLFADGADKKAMLDLYRNPLIQGFTTNPTLMRKAGITDYEAFARDILSEIRDRPISLEVFADEFDEMERQARLITSWGANVYVKIPVTNTKRQPATELIHRLSHEGIRLNITAILTIEQVRCVAAALAGGAPSYVSVFAGRIADTGRDPLPLMTNAVEIVSVHPGMELIWASPRELLNVFQADSIGCHIITATPDVLQKLSLVGKDLDEYSLDTVKMFHSDATKSGFKV